MKKGWNILLAMASLLLVTLGLPFLYAAGVPSFDVVLREVFGEKSLWAIAFSTLLIGTLLTGMNRLVSRE